VVERTVSQAAVSVLEATKFQPMSNNMAKKMSEEKTLIEYAQRMLPASIRLIASNQALRIWSPIRFHRNVR